MMRETGNEPLATAVCVCVCKSHMCSRASCLPAGVVLDPAVCVRVGQFGRRARPANSRAAAVQSIYRDVPFNDVIRSYSYRKAKQIVHS